MHSSRRLEVMEASRIVIGRSTDYSSVIQRIPNEPTRDPTDPTDPSCCNGGASGGESGLVTSLLRDYSSPPGT